MTTTATRQNIFQSLARIGTDGVTDDDDRNRIIMVNTFSLVITGLLVVIGISINYLLKWRLSVVIPLCIEIVINCSVVYLNYKKHHQAAALTLFILQCAAILYFGSLLGELFHLQFMIMFLISIIYLIFKDQTVRKIALYSALGTLFFLQGLYLLNTYHPVPFSSKTGYVIQSLVLGGVLVLMLFVSKKYVNSNDSNAELVRANAFIRIFTAQVTHELRTPLNAVHQAAQLMKSEIAKNEQLKPIEPLVNMALAASDHTRSIVNNVLDIASIESGKMETLVKEAFLVQPFFEKILEVNEIIAQSHNLKIQLTIEGMPPVLISDPLNLNQITTNLLANAIKYGREGTPILLSVRGLGEQWSLQVLNQGPGIPKDKLDEIFDPFTTFKEKQVEGTGLGLYIVQHKVTAMGGTIIAESDPSSYTSFKITFPLTAGKLANIRKEEDEDELATDLTDTTVLIAEDHKLSALLLTMHLEELGCSVMAVKNGEELLQAVTHTRPDIIIMDQHMPVMDGAETTRQLKLDPTLRHIPIIVSTGDLFTASLDRMLEAGADTYIEKPVDIKSLRKVICRYLQQKNS